MVESIKELRKICQKPLKEYNLLREGIWRIPSIYITKILLYTPITPNQITFFMILLGFVTTYLFSIGSYWCFITGALILEFVYVLDGVDGEIARYKKISSLTGIFLDLIVHIANVSIPFIGLTLGLYKTNPSVTIVTFGLLATAFSLCSLDIQALKHHAIFKELVKYARHEKKYKFKTLKKIKLESKSESILKILFKKIMVPLHDALFMNQIIMFAAIFNKLYWVLVFYGLTFPVVWLVKMIYEYEIGTSAYDFLFEPYKKN